MKTTFSRTIRFSIVTPALAALMACGGDANEEGAATDTTGAAATAAGDIGASGGGVSPQEAVALMATANQTEIQAAQVAVEKATDAQVRQFAQKMQREHSQSAREIGELATRMNVDLQSSSQQGQLVQSLRQMSEQMSQQLNSTPKGPDFDRAYIDGQVQAHQAVLESLQRIAGSTGASGATPPPPAGTDTTQAASSPQQAAQKMIPRVQQHLDEARQIQTRLSSGSR
jgi:putative membrane protein